MPSPAPRPVRSGRFRALSALCWILGSVTAHCFPFGTDPREATVVATVDTKAMQERVHDLVAIGPRMGGTPSGVAAADYWAHGFESAGLAVQRIRDPELDAYQPLRWVATATRGEQVLELRDGWLCRGSPSTSAVDLPLFVFSDPEQCRERPAGEAFAALLPLSARRTLFRLPEDRRPSVLLLEAPGRVRDDSTPILALPPGLASPGLTVSRRESASLHEGSTAWQLHFECEAYSARAHPTTVLARLPAAANGDTEAPILLFCAHGDSDSGGPGADDNASGTAVVLEIATRLAALVAEGWRPPLEIRFAIWGTEIHSSRAYLEAAHADGSAARHVCVLNYDQAGTGPLHDCLYLEPDDLPANRSLMKIFRELASDYAGKEGLWPTFTSNKALGGTDSYVFAPDWSRGGSARDLPAFTFFTAAFGEAERVPVTDGFPSPAFPDGTIEIDCSPVYHESRDVPEATCDLEPANLRWCATMGALAALRLAAHPEGWAH